MNVNFSQESDIPQSNYDPLSWNQDTIEPLGMTQVIFKILGLSLGIALLIKGIGPLIQIPISIPTVLAIVLSPCIILGAVLAQK